MASGTTLATMRTRVAFKVGNRTGIDTTIDDNLNKATLYVLSTMRPQDMWGTVSFSTVSGTAEYTFAGIPVTDLYSILMLRDTTNDREILRGSMRHYNKLKQSTAASNLGDPRRWTRRGENLVLYSRIPGSVLSVKVTYLQRPPTMTGAQNFPLNLEWERPVEEYAAFLTWTDLNEAGKADARMKAFQAFIAPMDKPEAIEDEAPEASLVPYVASEDW